ncbi:Hypothetical predicted protein, partial [Pelobates cultripes]
MDSIPSLHTTLTLIAEHANLSGYMINLAKSTLMPLAMGPSQIRLIRNLSASKQLQPPSTIPLTPGPIRPQLQTIVYNSPNRPTMMGCTGSL